MKKLLSVLIIVFSGLVLHAGNWNPYVSNGTVTPAPLLPWQFNGTGELFFKVGNTGNDPLPYDPNPLPNNNVILKITLSSGVPNAVNALDALGGTWKTKFDWSWNSGTNTYTGYQNSDILGQSEGNITIQYKVTVNTTISSPSNGFNVNLTPPPYTNGVNATGDDAVSSYTFTQALDFGDAPASYGAASHEISFTTYLGATIDNETANQPSANALGDDNTGIDDEDGVTIPTLIRGTSGNITVAAVVPGFGVLNVWIDWDGNGDFTGAGEKIATDQLIFASGPVLVPYTVPGGAYITAATFARFRIIPFPGSLPTNLGPTGNSFGGEVEDYMVQIYNKADLGITKTDGSNFFAPGANNVYTVVVTNNGPNGMTGATVTDLTPAGTTITGWTAVFTGGTGSSGNTSGSGSINELINLAYPGSVTYTITVAVPCEYPGNLVNTASVAVPWNVIDDNPNNNSATDTDTQNTWTGAVSNDWNTPGNWTQGVPNCTTIGAVIPNVATNDPVINTTGNSTANLTIESGGLLTINPGMELNVCRCTQINQTDGLYLKSDATGNAKFIDNGITYANNGSVQVELYLTTCVGETDKFRCWHYVTSPVIDARVGVFTNDYMKSWDEPLGAWSPYYTHTGTLMNNLQGYAVNAQGSGVRTFHGQLLTGNQTTSPALTRTVNLGWGWNLVGNPYASPIDINSAGLTWNNVDAWVYYLDRAAGNYKAWPATNPYGYGTGTRYPLSMQGFFVHVTEGQTSGTLSFTNAARTFTSDHIFYKNSVPDLLWLKAEGITGMNDEIIVCFNPETNINTDATVDAVKLTGDKEAPQFYSVTPDQTHLSINTMPFAGINTVVPLEFYVESNGTGNYSITASNMETFRSGTRMTLEDKKTNTNQVLSENPVYNFSYTEGESSSRFLLHFYNPYFGIDEKKISQELAIYSYDNNIYVKDLTGMELKGQMMVYNLVGQGVATKNLTGGTLNKFSMNIEEGYYVVEVFSNDKVYHGKVYLTK
jgi:uncharacterized repeat protein (TIGR01451 family)